MENVHFNPVGVFHDILAKVYEDRPTKPVFVYSEESVNAIEAIEAEARKHARGEYTACADMLDIDVAYINAWRRF